MRRPRSLSIVCAVVASVLSVPASSHAEEGGGYVAKTYPSELKVSDGPEPVFAEDFENIEGDWVKLPDYVGATGTTYTGSDYWTSVAACNGLILRYASPPTPRSGCGAYDENDEAVENGAYYAPMAAGGEPSKANHAWTFWSDQPVTSGQVMLQSTSGIAVEPGGRFLRLGFDGVGMACSQAHPALSFSLVDEGVDHPAFGAAIDPCADPAKTVANPPSGPVKVASYLSDVGVQVSAERVDLVLRNESDQSIGNDGGIDNLRIFDVTPSLSAAFDPAGPLKVWDIADLNFTVTNSDDALKKDGWGLETKLPPGMNVVDGAQATSTCAVGSIDAHQRKVNISRGRLEADQASCTITVPVTARKAGTYTVGGEVTTTALNPASPVSIEYED